MPPRSNLSSISLASTSSASSVAVGFLGCGTIAKAIATGLATNDAVSHVAVTRRSESKSSALKKEFPDKISVHDENQAVVDCSDIVFCCVLPQQTSEVLQSLNFSDRHTLISLVSTSNLPQLIQDSGLDAEKVYKMICKFLHPLVGTYYCDCGVQNRSSSPHYSLLTSKFILGLPAVAKHEGVSLITPKRNHQLILSLLDSLGGYVQAETEEQMSAMMVPSGMMGPLYGILRQNRDWLMKKGITQSDATYLVGKMYWGMMQDAVRLCNKPEAFDDLVEEQTPGGLNEQALGNLGQLGVLDAYDQVSEAMFKRITGDSDGSL